MLRPQDPPNQDTQIARYTFKLNHNLNLNQNLNLNLHRDIPRNLSFLDLVAFKVVTFSVQTIMCIHQCLETLSVCAGVYICIYMFLNLSCVKSSLLTFFSHTHACRHWPRIPTSPRGPYLRNLEPAAALVNRSFPPFFTSRD